MQITDTSAEPEQLYYELRNRFRIPQDASYEQAIKLLSIWQEVQNMMYKSYIPVTIAYDVDFNTVSELETPSSGAGRHSDRAELYAGLPQKIHGGAYHWLSWPHYRYRGTRGKGRLRAIPQMIWWQGGLEATMEHYLSGATLKSRESECSS